MHLFGCLAPASCSFSEISDFGISICSNHLQMHQTWQCTSHISLSPIARMKEMKGKMAQDHGMPHKHSFSPQQKAFATLLFWIISLRQCLFHRQQVERLQGIPPGSPGETLPRSGVKPQSSRFKAHTIPLCHRCRQWAWFPQSRCLNDAPGSMLS